jgi:GrpB-like predicted nucleotidyltransferase (UPF0157 family)
MTNLIEPYNPYWKTEFEELKSYLLETLYGLNIDIQHVGSTSIPNLPAKPILDVDIIIHDKMLLSDISIRLENIGYINKGEQGIEGRFAFRQTSKHAPKKMTIKKWQEHHLYVCYAGSLALKNHILFRDAILNDRKLLEQYASLKMNLTNEIGITREKYTTRKTDFIISVLTKIGLDESELNEITNANV